MKWKGETEEQRERRISNWHRHFCLLPTQMRDGKWVWLETVWARIRRQPAGSVYWEYRDCVAEPEEPMTTPPPSPRKR